MGAAMAYEDGVFIIGAGPYGLSLAAHLSAGGVPFEIAGTPMESWRLNMPSGMLLKSEPYASSLSDPAGALTLERYRQAVGRPWVRSGNPVSLMEFCDYAQWFQHGTVGAVREIRVTTLTRSAKADRSGGFEVTLSDGTMRQVRQVVLATGIIPFRCVPPQLEPLRPALVSHSTDYRDFGGFAGREVIVVGRGQSALETAALLHEADAKPWIVTRAPMLGWHEPPQAVQSIWAKLLRPEAGIATGWPAWVCAELPWAFRHLPLATRRREVATRLGPRGAWWLKPRVVDRVKVSGSCYIVGVGERRGRVELSIVSSGGRQQVFEADHLIAATGFQVDMGRLGFLDQKLRAALALENGYPVLNGQYETSVPGLYAIGAMAAQSFGPVMRFMYGARHPARTLARRFGAAFGPRARPVRSGAPERGREVKVGAASAP
jgi:cation diffusion facilitator CzcD-associated flavoprotein CzcO